MPSRAADRWRVACKEGHRTLKQVKTDKKAASGRAKNARRNITTGKWWYCESCDDYYAHAIDLKEDCLIRPFNKLD